MGDPTLKNGLLILIGNGAAPEVFAWPCGANARSVTFTNNLGEEVTLDCTDPENEAAAVQRWVESQDTSISISGKVANESVAMWRNFVDTGAPKNIRVVMPGTGAQGGGYYELPAICQSLEWGSEGKGKTSFTASIVGAGSRGWTDAA